MIVIAGGGTGGHVLPALAIADSMKTLDPTVEIHFVGTKKGIETKLVAKEGYPLHFLPVSGLKNMPIVGKLKGLVQIPVAFFKSILLTWKLKPKAVLGVGGYASGPYLFIASLLGCRTFIWEPNAHPGWTNRILSHFVKTAFIVFEATRRDLKSKEIIPLGMPLRKSIGYSPREAHLKLRILIFGGSQGARGINAAVSDALIRFRDRDWFQHVEIIHQTGANDYETVFNKYRDASIEIETHPFLYDMDKRYAWSDLVFCRSGASTVAEIAAARKAAVFIPFPFAADDHQKKNAELLARDGASILVEQKDFTAEKFVEIVEKFLKEPALIESMERKVAQFHKPDAAEQIARLILA